MHRETEERKKGNPEESAALYLELANDKSQQNQLGHHDQELAQTYFLLVSKHVNSALGSARPQAQQNSNRNR